MQKMKVNDTTEIRIDKKNFKGKDLLDIRKYFIEKPVGEGKPPYTGYSKQGISIPIEIAEEILKLSNLELYGGFEEPAKEAKEEVVGEEVEDEEKQ